MAQQSINKLGLVGILVEITHREGVNKNNQEYVAGRAMFEVGKDNIVPVDFYQNVLKKDNTPNNVYKGIMTMINDFRSKTKDGREAADLVEIGAARLEENSFYSQGGGLIRDFRISAPFFQRAKAGATLENSFITTGIILNMVEEIKQDVPTGTLFVDLLTIGYRDRGDVIRFSVEGEEAVNYFNTSISNGDEVKLAGEILMTETIIEKKEEAAFGSPIIEHETKYERKLVVKSMALLTSEPVPQEEVQTILAEREGRMAQKKADAENSNKEKNTGSKPARNFSL